MKSKQLGNHNEKFLDLLCRSNGIHTVLIPDGCRRVPGRLIPVKSPFDRILGKAGKAAFIDYKTTAGKSYSYSMIDKEQALTLIGLESVGLTSGFLVFFSQLNRIVFYKASILFSLQPGTSLSVSDGIDCGSGFKTKITAIWTQNGR